MFKKDFTWGAATSSYQIEGAYNEDGKGVSIWDTYCEQDGKIYNGDNGNVACDHYNRYKEDIKIMKQLGIKAYRFSIAWTRILPKGIGEINQNGIDFYNNLIDELLENDITPYITIFHWDYPQELYYKGAWLNPQSPYWFMEYAKIIVENFSDRVKHFFTINEPQCMVGLGYELVCHAPGIKVSLRDRVIMVHNILIAHGLAVKVMRETAKSKIKIGCANTGFYPFPADENNIEDVEMAKKVFFNIDEIKNADDWVWNVGWWCDPIFLGEYPQCGLEFLGQYLPDGWEKDLKIINQPLDFLGQNLYEGFAVKALSNGEYEKVKKFEGHPRTACGWPVAPKALKWCVKFLHQRYNLPIYITENGMSCTDAISLDGKVHDPNRIDFLNRYLLALKEAVNEGADVEGYFHWSLLDNFEWGLGFNERFGIVYVDYTNQNRIIKDSGYWYSEVIKNNGENL